LSLHGLFADAGVGAQCDEPGLRVGVIEAERGFRKLAGYRAMPTLVAALRAHDAQLDRTEGKLDTAQAAA
jgi:hypothetical protein